MCGGVGRAPGSVHFESEVLGAWDRATWPGQSRTSSACSKCSGRMVVCVCVCVCTTEGANSNIVISLPSLFCLISINPC